ncbi:MAG: ABC transporter substrate-binding protein [Candidatus Hodarchaeota archaeon]
MRKNIIKVLVILLVNILALSTLVSNQFINEAPSSPELSSPPLNQSLVFGMSFNPIDLDPHLCYDSTSQKVITQICEGLYKYNTTDPLYPLIPVLATALPTFSPDGLNITIPLRTGVIFHDGTNFNATAVKWNFDRLNYFLNYSGNQYLPAPFNIPLPSDGSIQKTKAQIVYTLNGVPIINRTEVINPNTIKIVMNIPKASIINIFTSHSAFFLSPTSAQNQGKELNYLTYNDGDVLTGTGPFILQNYTLNDEVEFTGNPDYWQGAPILEDLTFTIFPSTTDLNMAVLYGDVDLCDDPRFDFVPIFESSENIILIEAGPTVTTSYMGFNGYMVNTTFRKAISYVIDYTYLIDVISSGNAYRLKSPIPAGIPMSNYSFNYPVYDRAYAQSIMQSMGYGIGFTTDAHWTAVADSGGWGFGWNITAQLEGTFRRDQALYISDCLRYLGINAPVVQIYFADLLTCLANDVGTLRRDKIPMYMLGWGPDYVDPENFISPLYSNRSSIWCNTYDYELEQLMLAGETIVEPIAREAIYDEIQRKLVEELYFFVWISTGKNYDVYYNYVHGWVPNAINRVDFYPVYIKDTIPPTITIYNPIPNQLFGTNAPDFSITVSDQFPINYTWYTIDGGLTNYTFSGSIGTINQTAWDNEISGPITIRFYANDSFGNIGFEEVNIIKDIDAPIVTIISPTPNQLCGITAPNFNIQITEPNLQQKLYSLNGRPNITFTTETQFSQTEWNNIGNGTVTIVFYAIDGMGNVNSSQVIVRKDAIMPDITINSPIANEEFIDPPDFTISIIEEDLDSTWYTVEGSTTQYPFTGLTGTIDTDAWDGADYGEITITFYAQDNAGNVGTESVTVVKKPPTRIPGYNVLIISGIFLATLIIITQKKKINLKK